MKKLFNILKEKLAPLSSKLQSLKSILPQKKPHSEKYYKRIAFLNKYSLIFHFLLACLLILAVETISRRDFVSAITFISNHTLAFLYNALIIFASLSLVYLTKYRTQMRILISGLWIFLGTVNGLILSNRVTPLRLHRLKMSAGSVRNAEHQLFYSGGGNHGRVRCGCLLCHSWSSLCKGTPLSGNAPYRAWSGLHCRSDFNRSSDYHTGSTEFQHSCFLFCKYCAGLL